MILGEGGGVWPNITKNHEIEGEGGRGSGENHEKSPNRGGGGREKSRIGCGGSQDSTGEKEK